MCEGLQGCMSPKCLEGRLADGARMPRPCQAEAGKCVQSLDFPQRFWMGHCVKELPMGPLCVAKHDGVDDE